MENQNDRISYTFSFKKSTNDYGSVSESYSYTSDVGPEEMLGTALHRVKTFVMDNAKEAYSKQVKGKQNSPARAPTASPRLQGDRPAPGVDHGHANGTWVIPKGKHQGKTLQDLGPDQVQSMIDFFSKGEGARGWCKDFCEQGAAYIQSAGGFDPGPQPPEFDSNAEIPF